MGFVHPVPDAAKLAQFYSKRYYASDHEWGYHVDYGTLKDGLKRTYRGILRRFDRHYPGRSPRRVLDVGCAYGFFLDVAREYWDPEELLGLDVTAEAERQNREKGHAFLRGFLEDADLPREHFDVVFIGDAFEHFHAPKRAVEKLAQIVAPGGVVVLTTVDFDAWLPRLLGRRWRLMTPPEHLFFWNRSSLERIFADAGFASRVSGYWLHYPKEYVRQRFDQQFGFPPFFLAFFPWNLIPIYSFDVLVGFFEKR
jgi:SAM-dependent methyltransferase